MQLLLNPSDHFWLFISIVAKLKRITHRQKAQSPPPQSVFFIFFWGRSLMPGTFETQQMTQAHSTLFLSTLPFVPCSQRMGSLYGSVTAWSQDSATFWSVGT